VVRRRSPYRSARFTDMARERGLSHPGDTLWKGVPGCGGSRGERPWRGKAGRSQYLDSDGRRGRRYNRSVLVTDQNGEVLVLAACLRLDENSRRGFDPDGNQTRWASGFAISQTPLGFQRPLYDTRIGSRCTGKERDAESGLDYFGARYYGSNMGRFMSPDWSEQPEAVPYADTDNPQSLNLYSYVLNNPLSHRDPDGHSCAPDTSSTDPKTGALTVTAGACHLDWWDLPGHAFVGLANIMTGHTREGAKQMFGAYSLPLSIAVPLVGIGGELTTLGLEGGAEALLSNGTKQAAKGVVESLPEGAQKDAAKRAVGRATTSEKVSIVKNPDGSLTVSKARPGAVNGQQIMETKISSGGQTNTVQRAFDPQAGYHIDPKGGSK